MMIKMNADLMKKVALLHEVSQQNRILELRLKYRYQKNAMVKECLKKQMDNLLKDCKDKERVENFEF